MAVFQNISYKSAVGCSTRHCFAKISAKYSGMGDADNQVLVIQKKNQIRPGAILEVICPTRDSDKTGAGIQNCHCIYCKQCPRHARLFSPRTRGVFFYFIQKPSNRRAERNLFSGKPHRVTHSYTTSQSDEPFIETRLFCSGGAQPNSQALLVHEYAFFRRPRTAIAYSC